MEFRLNKIDTDLRRKVNEAINEGKVHPKKEIQINKDKEQEESKEQAKEYKDIKVQKKKKIIVDAEKTCDVNIDGFIGDDKELKLKKGIYLDVKK